MRPGPTVPQAMAGSLPGSAVIAEVLFESVERDSSKIRGHRLDVRIDAITGLPERDPS